MNVDRDRLAALAVSFAVLVGGAGIGFGYWQNHEANARSVEIEQLVKEHSADLRVQDAENAALRGAVTYVEQSIAAICDSTYRVADCPKPPAVHP